MQMTNTLYLYHQIACSLCKVDLKTNIVEISIEMIWKNLFVVLQKNHMYQFLNVMKISKRVILHLSFFINKNIVHATSGGNAMLRLTYYI